MAYYVLPGSLSEFAMIIVSMYFYYCWGWQYPVLLAAGTVLSFFCARLVHSSNVKAYDQKLRKLILALCLAANLGLLFFFKYFNFFGSIVNSVFNAAVPAVSLMLTAGISFWSFQACSYIMDVYRGKTEPEKNFLDYLLYMSFFPKLIQGPIERAGELIPQLKEKNEFSFDKVASGLTLFITGLVKKMIVADNMALIVNTVFSKPDAHTGLQLVFASFCYTIQIYMDFSGYTNMARGSALFFGVELRENFNKPYFAVGVQDFWRRWHMSLTTWFRDYLYFPLGGSRVNRVRHLLNILIVFAVSGLWHGAAMNFIVWGLLHGIYQVFEILLKPLTSKVAAIFGKRKDLFGFLRGCFTFLLVNYAWIFFRANSISDAIFITKRMMLIPFNPLYPFNFSDLGLSRDNLLVTWGAALIIFVIEAVKDKIHLSARFNDSVWLRYSVYAVLLLAVFVFGYYGAGYDPIEFVYFKF